MAGAAAGSASSAHEPDDAVDPRPCCDDSDAAREGRLIMISDKVRPHHLERKAILYVRQSSAHQVLHNRESSALQYAMRDRLTALGGQRSK
jgi:hypothetical protein